MCQQWLCPDELLTVDVDHGAEQSPRTALSVHVQHPQDLQEPDPSHCGGCGQGAIVTRDQDENRGRDNNKI